MIPIKSETITQSGKFLESSTLHLENGGTYEMVKRIGGKNAVAGLIYHKEKDSFILIHQYRYPLRQRILELVAGVCDKNISKEMILGEEVKEETGYKEIVGIDYLMHCSNSAGLTSETTDLFFVEVAGEKQKQQLSVLEDIQVHEIKRSDISLFLGHQIQNGTIIDPKVCAALYMTQEKIGKILRKEYN